MKKEKRKKKRVNEENEEDLENEIKNNLKEKKKIKRKAKQIEKMKELMELKIEKPPYADQIKRYKYPKKNDKPENELVFFPLPEQLIMCVIGDEKTGKTSFIRKYMSDVFEEAYQKTEKIENDENETEIDSKQIKIKILDTPALTNKKYIKLIQEEAINKSHIIIYIIDINDEYAEFKVKLIPQVFDFNDKHIIVVIGNKSDKVSIYSSKNREAIWDYCDIRKFIFKTISCSDMSKNEIEDFMNSKVIKEYLTLNKE
jgi:GTPase SAR1 family protein